MRVLLVGLVASVAALGRSQARAQAEFSVGVSINSVGDFHSPLAGIGAWVQLGSYGQCWHPTGVAVGWRPYSVGQWEWTDVGWYWVSDEPWAWACYHYGYWVNDPTYGWCWIPGTQWAPAWVDWRTGGDYIGWAPRGPGGVVLAGTAFVFVNTRSFADPVRMDRLIVGNTAIIRQTRVIGSASRETVNIGGARRSVFFNRGPDVNTIQRTTGRKFAPTPVTDVARRTPAPENMRRNAPETRTPEHPVPPTGREHTPGYQEQPRETPRNNPRSSQPTLPPTGREHAPGYQEQPREQPKGNPRGSEQTVPPTGREQHAPGYQEQPQQAPRSEQQRTPEQTRPSAPERNVPSTPPEQREFSTPEHPVAPSPAERPPGPTGREQQAPTISPNRSREATPAEPPAQQQPRATGREQQAPTASPDRSRETTPAGPPAQQAPGSTGRQQRSPTTSSPNHSHQGTPSTPPAPQQNHDQNKST